MPLASWSWNDGPISPAVITLGTIGLIFILLIFSTVTPDLIMIGGVVLLLLLGILTPSEALGGIAKREASSSSPRGCSAARKRPPGRSCDS
jgi:hypothetical protein